MTDIWPHIAILGFVTAQRLIELPIARANTAKLLAAGGREVAHSQGGTGRPLERRNAALNSLLA